MQLKKSILGSMISLALAGTYSVSVLANEGFPDASKLKDISNKAQIQKSSANQYIVQLKGIPGIAKAEELGELLPSNQTVALAHNRYNATTPTMKAYVNKLQAKQEAVAGDVGVANIIYSYKHAFNGFSAKLTDKQKAQLEANENVVGVWLDVAEQVNTANTPKFLGLTEPGGQLALGIKGEDVIVGILDTGIWPENPSFADDGSYSDPATLGWQGECQQGDVEQAGEFLCNNKLIGARFYDAGFKATYKIQTELGEFISPRDADGHGSHTAGTAAGNENVAAAIDGFAIGNVSGMAPRARIAAYKVCWNSDYTSPAGVAERGCFGSDRMAAIDQAILDGVDVLNHSIGGSRTDLTVPVSAAMLRAAQAGIFVANSAGNSGNDPDDPGADGMGSETVGTPAPWITTVAASTYTGNTLLVGKELTVSVDDAEPSALVSISAAEAIAPAPAEGFSGELVMASPIEACDDAGLTNGDAVAGKVALISRGSCNFTKKILNAEQAGATGVVVYNNRAGAPFAMGGDAAGITIPAVMVSQIDGENLVENFSIGTTTVGFTQTPIAGEQAEVGNVMADFSSKGPNSASYDIITPDITGPGVKVVAATTAAPMFEPHGQSFKYLSGTSMSSPHIAGIAALFKGSNPEWSPAEIKSALMTTARQNVTLTDGSAAGPFNFGSGYVAPVKAMAPGLLYDSNTNDYLAFLCGLGNSAFVANYGGANCEQLTAQGFATDASQLNMPSIGIAQLTEPETITRTVTNAEDVASVYTATIEMPAGVNIELATFDGEGNKVENNTLPVSANGKASYALTFSQTAGVAVNTWLFGSITWNDELGHSVRSPIAVRALPVEKIVVPQNISGTLKRGRFSYPVQMKYSGRTSIEYTGLTAPFFSSRAISQDEDQRFTFNEDSLGKHFFAIPEGTKVARFSLLNGLVDVEGTDLDLYVYHCINRRCNRVDFSFNSGSNENVTLINPAPAADFAAGDFYYVMVHGYDVPGDAPANYRMPVWISDSKEANTRIVTSRRAIDGRFNNVSILTRGLTRGVYMGGVTHLNAEGVAEGTTAVEIVVD